MSFYKSLNINSVIVSKPKSSRFTPLSRAEKSLTALTTKFMTLLQESHNGVLDLRSVYKYLLIGLCLYFLLFYLYL